MKIDRKQSRQQINTIVTSIITFIASIAVWIFLTTLDSTVNNSEANNIYSTILIGVVSSIISSTLIFMFLRVFNQTPSTLNISLLGFPNSGKTVYLTVLFNDLMTEKNSEGVSFRTYGTETIERISTDYLLLSNGKWLPPTPNEGVFYYRATTNTSNYKKYKLEIADYAGEKFITELKENNYFFHKTDFYQYVILSDIVFLTVDLSKVMSESYENNAYITIVENSFIAVINLMQESKNVGFNKSIKFPVSLLFLKSDLLSDKQNEEWIIKKFNRLIGYCQKNCLYFKYFFVSSTGTSFIEYGIEPKGVIEPIIWSIRKVR